MGKKCAICDKGTVFGNQISHSHRVTSRRWKQIFKECIVVNGRTQRAYVCTRCLKGGKVERAI